SGDTTSFSNPLVLTMRSNHDIVATFTINMYALTITVRGNGTVTKQPSLPTYPYGSVVQVTAIPDPGYHLSSWSGASGGTTNPLNITMDGNKALIATFKATDATFELPDGFASQLVISGLDEPVGMAFLPDGRVFVVERESGRIRLIVEGSLGAVDPIAVVDSVQSAEGERGLLGVVADPGWPQRPYLYV